MVLSRYDSPFVTGERQPQFGDLCFAIWVCKRNWAELMEGLSRMSFLKEIKFLRFIGRFRQKELAMLTFVDYVTKALKEPNLFFNKVDDAKPMSMNNLHYLKIILMLKLHMTKEQVMDMPFGEAIYDVAAVGESEGACGFVSDSHAAAGEAARRNHEKRQAEMVKENGERN